MSPAGWGCRHSPHRARSSQVRDQAGRPRRAVPTPRRPPPITLKQGFGGGGAQRRLIPHPWPQRSILPVQRGSRLVPVTPPEVKSARKRHHEEGSGAEEPRRVPRMVPLTAGLWVPEPPVPGFGHPRPQAKPWRLTALPPTAFIGATHRGSVFQLLQQPRCLRSSSSFSRRHRRQRRPATEIPGFSSQPTETHPPPAPDLPWDKVRSMSMMGRGGTPAPRPCRQPDGVLARDVLDWEPPPSRGNSGRWRCLTEASISPPCPQGHRHTGPCRGVCSQAGERDGQGAAKPSAASAPATVKPAVPTR